MKDKNKPQLATAPLSEELAEAPAPEPEEKKLAEVEFRVSGMEEALRAEKARADDLFKRLQYLQADFENYRKRMEKEMGDTRRFGNERLLMDLLAVNDEMELALMKARENEESPVLLDGVGMVLKRLQNILSKEGVDRIPGVGSKFTPDLQEAALRVVSTEEEGTIVEEIRPGFMLKGRVLRPSIVKVAVRESTVETAKEDEKA